MTGVTSLPQVCLCVAQFLPVNLARLLVLYMLFTTRNAKKRVSHTQVDGKGIRNQMTALATLVYEEAMAD